MCRRERERWGRGSRRVRWDKRDGRVRRVEKSHLDRHDVVVYGEENDMMGERIAGVNEKVDGDERGDEMVTIMVMLMILVITNQNWRFNFYCCDAHFYLIVWAWVFPSCKAASRVRRDAVFLLRKLSDSRALRKRPRDHRQGNSEDF